MSVSYSQYDWEFSQGEKVNVKYREEQVLIFSSPRWDVVMNEKTMWSEVKHWQPEGERERGQGVRHVITCYPWWMAISSHSTGSYRGLLFLFSFILVLVYRVDTRFRDHPSHAGHTQHRIKPSKTLYSHQLHGYYTTGIINLQRCCAATGCFTTLFMQLLGHSCCRSLNFHFS